MGRIAVVTDSAAAITPEILKERQERGGFAVVPMPVSVKRHPHVQASGHTNRDEYPRFNRS